MNLQQFIAWADGQSLLYNTSDATLRGQCVQMVCFYVVKVWGRGVIWADAWKWYFSTALADQYDRIPNDHNNVNQVPPVGALIVWDPSLPGSNGGGHIAVCVSATPGAPTFVSFDSNWGGKTAHLVTHNWSYVVGWLVPHSAPAPPPAAPAPQTSGGIEMIENQTQAVQAYQLLRPNGSASQDEINATAGKRSWAQFANDSKTEVTQRDNNLKSQADHLADMQTTINSQNQTITDLTTKLSDATTTGTEKQAALTAALQKLGAQNAEMATKHDLLSDLQGQLQTIGSNVYKELGNPTIKTSTITKFLARLRRSKA